MTTRRNRAIPHPRWMSACGAESKNGSRKVNEGHDTREAEIGDGARWGEKGHGLRLDCATLLVRE